MEEQAKLICSFSTQTESDETKNRSSYPTGVAVTPAGHYVIADGASLKLFDVKGGLRNVMTSDDVRMTYDVTCSRSGKTMVTDPKCGDVKVFSKLGKYLTTSESGHLLEPCGIHYDGDTCQTCVTDSGTSCVYVHDADGIVTQVLTGKYHDAETCTVSSRKHGTDYDVTQLQSPGYVTMDTNKNVLVSDSAANAIYCFDGITGAPVWRYGELGSDDYELQNPAGVCVDHHGNILVADSTNCRVHLLNAQGEFIDYVLTWEDGVADPQAITTNSWGHLVVTESAAGLVKVFDYISKLSTAPPGGKTPSEADCDDY